MREVHMFKPTVNFCCVPKAVDLSDPQFYGGFVRRTLQKFAAWLTRKSKLEYSENVKVEESITRVRYDDENIVNTLGLCQHDMMRIWNMKQNTLLLVTRCSKKYCVTMTPKIQCS